VRQDHATRCGELREVEIRIEAAGCSIAAKLLNVIRAILIMFRSNPNEEIEDGKALPIERRFTRGERTLPELRLVDEIKPSWDWQRRVDEELLQWSASARQATLVIDAARLALSTAARDGISFGKILVKHGFLLLLLLAEVEQ